MRIPNDAVLAVEGALIAHSAETRHAAICHHQARIAAEAAAPALMRAAMETVIARIDFGAPLMTTREYREGARWVKAQIEDVLIPALTDPENIPSEAGPHE